MQLGVYGRSYLIAGLALVAGLAIAYQFVQPAPPERVLMATGVVTGAYHRYGERYREIFARESVTLELRPTAGSVENLRLLEEEGSGVGIALVQGGLAIAREEPVLQTMGGMFVEPLWVFTRLTPVPSLLSELRGKRLAVGAEHSGTRAQALRLLAASGIEETNTRFLGLPASELVQAFEADAIDAALLVSAPSARVLRDLAMLPGVRLMDFAQARGYAQVDRTIETAVLERGALGFGRDLPPAPIRMPATTADLVVRADLHPAVKDLLMVAAQEVHEEGTLFSPPGRYPARFQTALPLAPEALRFYENGPPFLQRWMPFWAATFVNRTAVLLIPIVTLLLPLIRLLPPIVTWQIQSRVYRWYGRLMEIENAVAGGTAADIAAAREALARIDHEVAQIKVPLSYNHMVYRLRSHLDLVRGRVEAMADQRRNI